ncbi:MAG: polysaccharide biosynthesis tyrosine autokinase [Synechococcales cyanobacterium]
MVGVTAIAIAGTISYTAVQPQIFESRFRLLLGSSQSQTLPGLAGLSAITNTSVISRDQATNVTILQSEPVVTQGIDAVNATGTFPPLTFGEVRPNLTIQSSSNSDIISISYLDVIPERATALLNELEKVYLQRSLDERTAQARNSLQLIESQLPVLEQRLNESSQKLEDFRRQYSFPDPDGYASALATARTTYERSIRETDISVDQLERQQQELVNQLRQSGANPDLAIPTLLLSQSPEYLRLTNQLQQVESQLALDRLRLREDSPQIQQLLSTREQLLLSVQDQVQALLGSSELLPQLTVPSRSTNPRSVPVLTDSLGLPGGVDSGLDPSAVSPLSAAENVITEQEIDQASSFARAASFQQNLTNQLLGVQVNIAVQETRRVALESALQATQLQFDQIPPLQRQYSEMLRQLNLDVTAITTLRQRQQELQLAQAQEIPPWRTVETAIVPTRPVSPNVPRNLILGTLSGLILGLILAIFIETLDSHIKSPDEAKSATKLILLGAIPKLPGMSVQRSKLQWYQRLIASVDRFSRSLSKSLRKDRRTQRTKQHSLMTYTPIVEAFRSLAFTLVYGNKSLRVFAITSSLPAEGKSTSSHMLAQSLAEFGHTVLLVDADMRRPTQHEIAGIANAVGLSNVLHRDRDWRTVLHHAAPRLDVLVAGAAPFNPLLLLGSPEMASLISEWQKEYEYVIIDTPPLVGIGDTPAIARLVDATILVVGMGTASFESVGRTLESLTQTGTNLLGFVANYVERQGSGYEYAEYYVDPAQKPLSASGSRNGTLR